MRKTLCSFALCFGFVSIFETPAAHATFTCEGVFESTSVRTQQDIETLELMRATIDVLAAAPKRVREQLTDNDQVKAVKNIADIVGISNQIHAVSESNPDVRAAQVALKNRLYDFVRVHMGATFQTGPIRDVHGLQREITVISQQDLAYKELTKLAFNKAPAENQSSDATKVKSIFSVITHLERDFPRQRDGKFSERDQVRAYVTLKNLVRSVNEVALRASTADGTRIKDKARARLQKLAVNGFGFIYMKTPNYDLHRISNTDREVNMLDHVWQAIGKLD